MHLSKLNFRYSDKLILGLRPKYKQIETLLLCIQNNHKKIIFAYWIIKIAILRKNVLIFNFYSNIIISNNLNEIYNGGIALYKITVIPGDGIGEEVTQSVIQMVDSLNLPIEWEIVSAGLNTYNNTGELLPESALNSIETNRIVLKGPITTPIGYGFKSINVTLRTKYNLYANIRPVKNLGVIDSKYKNIDLVIFRENTEDLYAGIEEKISDNECHSLKIITKSATLKIAHEAFKYAQSMNKTKVTVVTKANIMKLTDGLFLNTVREVALDYPNIELEELLIDNMCMQLVLNPSRYQIILTSNLYGDILSDLCAGLIGGLGLVPSANIGKDIALFEAVHGSALDIAGANKANPTALALSAAMMLDYIGENLAAKKLKNALNEVLCYEDNFTYDLGGNLSTSDFTQKVIETIQTL